MKKIVMSVLVLVSMFCTPVHAEEDVTKWTTADVSMQAVYTALHVLDWGQTRWMVKHPYTIKRTSGMDPDGTGWSKAELYEYKESNPILGHYPSMGKVNAYFITSLVGHTAVSHYLPTVVKALGGSDNAAKYSRTIWQSLTIGLEGGVTIRNVNLGVGFSF